jgi:hypothetical protein
MKSLSILVLAAVLAATASACDRQALPRFPGGGRPPARFQGVTGPTDTFLVDVVTGDLWILDEQPGDEGAVWVRYAKGPKDARPLGPKRPAGGATAP